jgi:hypothetical protein
MLGVVLYSLLLLVPTYGRRPRNIFEPGFFETEQGVVGGLTGLYESLRQCLWTTLLLRSSEGVPKNILWIASGRKLQECRSKIQGSIPDAANSRFDVYGIQL